MIYSKRSWKMEHFLFLRHVLNRCSFWGNCVWICYKLFVIIHKFFWIVYYNEELVTNSKFQIQLSQKLQRFRTCCKNKKCSSFHFCDSFFRSHVNFNTKFGYSNYPYCIKKNPNSCSDEPKLLWSAAVESFFRLLSPSF